MSAYTTAKFLAAVERRSFAPENQTTFDTTDILAIADEVIKSKILPAILKPREEFYATYKDYSITEDQAAYEIPVRAVGMLAREVVVVRDSKITPLARTELDRITSTQSTGNAPESFYFRGSDLVLHPIPGSTQDTLRVYYYIRPGELVEAADTAVISAINTTTNVVTVNTIPSTWATGNTFDFIRKNGAHDYRGVDYTSTLVSGTDITFSSLPTGLVVGDYLALEGESSLVQIPPDFQPALVTLTAAVLIKSQNQTNGDKLEKEGMELLVEAQKMVTPRAIGEDQVIVADWF